MLSIGKLLILQFAGWARFAPLPVSLYKIVYRAQKAKERRGTEMFFGRMGA
jgi:hypothetical protein